MTGPEMIQAGKMMEAGFEAWRLDHFPKISGTDLARLRDCFFAGGLHATTMMGVGDADAIAQELIDWGKGK